jgi:hypothetical protein
VEVGLGVVWVVKFLSGGVDAFGVGCGRVKGKDEDEDVIDSISIHTLCGRTERVRSMN